MTNDATRDDFIDWLRDAHAMEQQAITMLNGQANRLEHYPELRAKFEQHLQETKAQSAQLERILERYGAKPSAVKDMGAKASAAMSAFGDMMAGDEVMKGAMMSYTFEHFEISSYKILIAAAEVLGDHESKGTLQNILDEEMKTAEWLAAHLPSLTRAYLARDAADMDAKR